jgi:glyceraldehyde-3-phosphate dehydrogenase (NADP+)
MKMLLAGQWVDREKTIRVRDPWDDALVDTVPGGLHRRRRDGLAAASAARRTARAMSAWERSRVLLETAAIVEGRLEDFARTIAREGSKTIREARKEARRCVNTLTISGEEAKRLVGETIPFDSFPGGEQRAATSSAMPIGVVVAITPFNDPLNLVAHKLGPAIAGGNAVVLKPATVTPLSALKLTEAFDAAGLPAGVLQCMTGYGSVLGDALVSDPRVRMVSFTGGLEAGPTHRRQGGAEEDRHGARLQLAGHRLARRRPRVGGRDLRLRCLLGRRPELHRRAADLHPP